MEFLVKLFQEDSPFESPACRLLNGIHIPPLRHDTVLNDTRVGYQRIDSVGRHHRHGVTFVYSGSRMFPWLFTRCQQQEHKEGDGNT